MSNLITHVCSLILCFWRGKKRQQIKTQFLFFGCFDFLGFCGFCIHVIVISKFSKVFSQATTKKLTPLWIGWRSPKSSPVRRKRSSRPKSSRLEALGEAFLGVLAFAAFRCRSMSLKKGVLLRCFSAASVSLTRVWVLKKKKRRTKNNMNNGFSCSAGSTMKCHSKGHVARTLVSGGTPCKRTWWTFQQAVFGLTRGSFAQLRWVISVTLNHKLCVTKFT